jgi:arginase family enzyme
VPCDGGTPQPGNRTGQKLGPSAARLASWEPFTYGESLEHGAIGWYDIETDRDRLRGVTMVDVGDVVIQGADDHGNFARMREAANQIVARGCVLVAMGGDHSTRTPTSWMNSRPPVSPGPANSGESLSSRRSRV